MNGSNVQLKIFVFPFLMIYEKFEYFLWFQSVILETYNLFMICLNDRDSRLMKHHKLSRNAIFSWKIMKKTCILRFMHCVACYEVLLIFRVSSHLPANGVSNCDCSSYSSASDSCRVLSSVL